MNANFVTALNQMKEGREAGFNVVYSQTYNYSYNVVREYVAYEELVCKALHLAYVEAYRNIHTLQAVEYFQNWLDAIVRRHGLSLSETGNVENVLDNTVEKVGTKLVGNTLPIQTAQEIYNACCITLGLAPSEIHKIQPAAAHESVKAPAAAKEDVVNKKSVKEVVAEKVKETIKDEIKGVVKDEIKEGAKQLVTEAGKEVGKQAVAEGTGEAVGLLAKFAALSTKMKAAVVTGTLVTSVATVGVVGTVATSLSDNDTEITEETGSVLEELDLSRCMGLYDAEEDDYSGEPLLYPVKVSEDTYAFYPGEIAKHFDSEDYGAVVILDSMPEDVAVAYVAYGAGGEDMVYSWSDEKAVVVSCFEGHSVIVTVSLSNDKEEIRQNMYNE